MLFRANGLVLPSTSKTKELITYVKFSSAKRGKQIADNMQQIINKRAFFFIF
jgi:hypothetical protein